MTSLTIKTVSTIDKETFIKYLTDFGLDRHTIWTNSQQQYYKVHKLGNHTAEVTEGSKHFGGAWERVKYDWSDLNNIYIKTIDSNIWNKNSGWHYRLSDHSKGSLIEFTVTRYPNSQKGRLILIFMMCIGKPVLTRNFKQILKAIEHQSKNKLV